MQKEDIIIDLIKEFKKSVDQRFKSIDQRFEAVDQCFVAVGQRFDAVDTQVSSIKEDTHDLKDEQKEIKSSMKSMATVQLQQASELRSEMLYDRKKIDKVYDTRHEVEYKITRDFIVKNIGWNFVFIVCGVLLVEAVIT